MSFISDIKRFKVKASGNMEKTVRGTALSMFSHIITRTPRDTGRLVGNWQVSFNGYGRSQLQRKETHQGANKRASARGNKYKVNNLPYARVIEYGLYTGGGKPQRVRRKGRMVTEIRTTAAGFSTQAPKGMVGIVKREFKQTMKRNAGRVNR